MNSEVSTAEQGATPQILSVGELNRLVGRLLERSFPLLWVAGEISNLTRAASGHWYFSLKDREAQVRCVMFRGRNQLVDWVPKEGDRVEARAVVGLYAARGDFQLTVEALRRAGAGALYEAFLRLKAKLEAEGLFAAERKRVVPPFVRSIGVVTSSGAAALRDVLSTLRRRAPHVRIVVYPAPVQGKEAPARLLEVLTAAGERARRFGETDVLLLVRGGGSIEDLWAYNDEALARAIARHPVPVITGIGHETDFTIADFVADLRAPTPTAAAELAAPDRAALGRAVAGIEAALRQLLGRRIERAEQGLDELQRRLKSPLQRLGDAQQRLSVAAVRLRRAESTILERLARRLEFAAESWRRGRPDGLDQARDLAASVRLLAQRFQTRFARANAALELARTRLALLNPHGLLERGYAIVNDARGEIVRDASQLLPGEQIALRFARGTADARIVSVDPEKT